MKPWIIEDGDSNIVCLAKTMLAIQQASLAQPIDVDELEELIHEGVEYAGEVLNERS